MIRFALIVASTLGFVLTAALGNLMTPLLRAFRVQQEENEPPTMGGLCLMVGTLAAVGVGWTAACVAQPELLGTESLLTTRLLIALFGALCFGVVGLADDVVRLRHRSPLGLRRPVRLALEAASGTLVLALLGLNHCLPDGLALPGVGYCTLGPLAPVVWLAILVALAESARTADGMDGTVCGCAFIAMLGLMTAMTLLGWFPLGVLPAALAGALMAFLLWNFLPRKAPPRCSGMPVSSRCAGLCAAERRLARADAPAGSALLAGRRHGGVCRSSSGKPPAGGGSCSAPRRSTAGWKSGALTR